MGFKVGPGNQTNKLSAWDRFKAEKNDKKPAGFDDEDGAQDFKSRGPKSNDLGNSDLDSDWGDPIPGPGARPPSPKAGKGTPVGGNPTAGRGIPAEARPTLPGKGFSGTMAQLWGDKGAVGSGEGYLRAADVKTTADYARFVGQLESRYPEASSFEINRAVRQYFYSDNGVKNTDSRFDSWLGKDGGLNSPALQGIREDLEGLPSRIMDSEGDQVDLSHLAVGIDAYYNQKVGDNGLLEAPLDAAKGFMLTHGGDFGQVFAASFMAAGNALGVSEGDETFTNIWKYASEDQLRGNQSGISIGFRMGAQDKLSDMLGESYGSSADLL